MKNPILLLLLITLGILDLSCTKDNDVGSDGTYDLRTIDGNALPYDVLDPPPIIREIKYVLVLSKDTYTQTRTSLFGSETPTTSSISGFYTSNNGTVILHNASYIGGLAPGQSHPPITGFLEGQKLTLVEGAHAQLPAGSGLTLVFDKR